MREKSILAKPLRGQLDNRYYTQALLDAGQLDDRYYTETELGSNVVRSSGASLIGLNSLDDTLVSVQLSIDGINSSLYYSGGIISENVALDGTIDISEVIGAIKTSADNEATEMGAFTVSEALAQSISFGINYICVDYNSGTPIFTIVQSEPNHSTIMPLARAYKDANNHVHIQQSGHKFLDFPYKVHKRFSKVYGVERSSGLVTSESAIHDLCLAITAGSAWKGINEFNINDFDSGRYDRITGDGTGGTISANNTIVLDSGVGDQTEHYTHGMEIWIEDSTNGNDGSYHVQSSSYAAFNTTVIIEETTLTPGDDTGAHVHYETFTYWYYRLFDTTWVETDKEGNHVSSIIDVAYWNDITDEDEGDELKVFIANRYGIAWIYQAITDDARIHVLYGQGNYTAAQAAEAGTPTFVPDIVSEMCMLIAKVVFQEGATNFSNITYPWETVFLAAAVAIHNNLATLQGGQADQYYHFNSAEHTEIKAFFNATDISGAEAEQLTDDSMADVLHRHSELSASDGSPDPALSVDIDGKVGIGTTSPASALHVKGGTPGTIGSHPAGQIIIQNPAQSMYSNAIITAYESDGDGNPDQQLWYLGSASGGNSDIIFLNRRSSNLKLGTSGIAQVTIDYAGNVGIGVTDPDSKLEVNGTGHFTGKVTLDAEGTSDDHAITKKYVDDNAPGFAVAAVLGTL